MINVLSLGAGKQSSYMLLRALDGYFDSKPEYAIFSDVGCEPQYVYDFINWLKDYVKAKYDFDIIIIKGRDLMQDTEDYYSGKNRCGASIPAFLSGGGIIRRQCTYEYKIAPMKRYLQKIRKGERIKFWIGISLDEIQRIRESGTKYIENYYPLIDNRVTIDSIVNWFNESGLPKPGKSACLICPFHSNRYWQRFKKEYPDEFEKACKFDDTIRVHPSLVSDLYLHRSLKPLREVDFSFQPSLFPELIEECEGLCGL